MQGQGSREAANCGATKRHRDAERAGLPVGNRAPTRVWGSATKPSTTRLAQGETLLQGAELNCFNFVMFRAAAGVSRFIAQDPDRTRERASG